MNQDDCVMCGGNVDFGIVLPYGSEFDGDFVCSDCINKYLDPIIKEKYKAIMGIKVILDDSLDDTEWKLQNEQ